MFFNDPSLYNVTWPTKETFGQIPFTPWQTLPWQGYMMQNFPVQQWGQKTPYFGMGQPYFNFGCSQQAQNFPYYPNYPIQGFSLPYQTPFHPYFQASTPYFPFYGYRPF